MRRQFIERSIALSLSVMLLSSAAVPVTTMANAGNDGEYSLTDSFSVPGGDKYISIDATNDNIRTLMYNLSEKAGFNLMMDDSVTGEISLQLNNVTINQALKAIATVGNLEFVKKNGNIYLAISKETAKEKGLDRLFSKVIKVHYSNAGRIAAVLNQTIFAPADNQSAQNAAEQKVRADARTNSLILVGTKSEIQLAEKSIEGLDLPRQSKTFYLSNANALDVAGMLTASLFNEGNALLSTGGGSAPAAAAGGAQGVFVPNSPSQLRVEKEKLQEGSGINNFGGSSGNAATAGLGQSITLRGTVKESTTVSVSPEGPLVVPDTRTNSITIMGTVEQIAMAESMIPVLDAQLPQVTIEASLVEITEQGQKELQNGWGLGEGRWQFGFNNEARAYNGADPSAGGSRLIGIGTVDTGGNRFGSVGFTSNPLTKSKHLTTQIRSLLQTNKARLISNPSIVATHDTESVISVVDEIVRKVTVTVSGQAGTTTQEIELGEAGIVLDILPKVGEDGTVTMRLRPSVSTIRQITTDSLGNIITLLKKRDLLTQSVRVQDNETIVLGGLVKEDDSITSQKLPGLADLPIVGAMFRASQRSKGKSELVLMVTPHILNKTNITPVHYTKPIGETSYNGTGE